MWTRVSRNYFLLILALLIVWAWLVLWTLGQSPYGRYIDHEQLSELSLKDGVGGILVLAAVFVGGWTLMTTAMMLPTTLPLLQMFRRLTYRRQDHARLVFLLIAGYMGIWGVFGIFAHIGDWGLHLVAEQITWLDSNEWVIGAGTLILAGVYQFTPLKYHCLDKCRSPRSFIMEHWRGRDEKRQALLLGVHHGIFCVGCCWSLMLLMFAIGVGNIGWMLAVGTVMAIEKNMPWGRKLSAPLGAALIGSGLAILLNPSWSL